MRRRQLENDKGEQSGFASYKEIMIASSKFGERFLIHVTCVMLFVRIVALLLQVICTCVDEEARVEFF